MSFRGTSWTVSWDPGTESGHFLLFPQPCWCKYATSNPACDSGVCLYCTEQESGTRHARPQPLFRCLDHCIRQMMKRHVHPSTFYWNCTTLGGWFICMCALYISVHLLKLKQHPSTINQVSAFIFCGQSANFGLLCPSSRLISETFERTRRFSGHYLMFFDCLRARLALHGIGLTRSID